MEWVFTDGCDEEEGPSGGQSRWGQSMLFGGALPFHFLLGTKIELA